MSKQGANFSATNKVLKPIIDYYKQDKLKLIRFLVKEGYLKQDIAKVLDVTPSAITYLLKREENENNC